MKTTNAGTLAKFLFGAFLHEQVALPSTLKAYHVGSMKPGQQPSLNSIGSGENNHFLGPGMYFSSNPNLAMEYAKYVSGDAYIHTAELDTSGYYDPTYGLPTNLREKLLDLLDQLVAKGTVTKRRLQYGPSSPMRFGKGSIGTVIESLGVLEGRAALREIGITGVYEKLPEGVECAVYDLSTIQITNSELVSEFRRKS